MSDTLTQPKPKTDADYEESVRQLLAEMSRVEEQMDRSRAESERLKLETQAIKKSAEITLARLEEHVLNLTSSR